MASWKDLSKSHFERKLFFSRTQIYVYVTLRNDTKIKLVYLTRSFFYTSMSLIFTFLPKNAKIRLFCHTKSFFYQRIRKYTYFIPQEYFLMKQTEIRLFCFTRSFFYRYIGKYVYFFGGGRIRFSIDGYENTSILFHVAIFSWRIRKYDYFNTRENFLPKDTKIRLFYYKMYEKTSSLL